MTENDLSEQHHHSNEGKTEGAFQLSEAHRRRNKRILAKLAKSKSKSKRKVTKEEAYRQYCMIKAHSNRSRNKSEDP